MFKKAEIFDLTPKYPVHSLPGFTQSFTLAETNNPLVSLSVPPGCPYH